MQFQLMWLVKQIAAGSFMVEALVVLGLTIEAVVTGVLVFKAQTYAIQVNPEAYAARFCEMRNSGAGLQKSIDEAIRVSYTDPGIPTQVTRGGVEYNSDMLAATDLAAQRCPGSPGGITSR